MGLLTTKRGLLVRHRSERASYRLGLLQDMRGDHRAYKVARGFVIAVL